MEIKPKERTVYLEGEASKMVDYTRINVSKDGKYLFATEQGQLTYDLEAKRVYKLLKEKIPRKRRLQSFCNRMESKRN